jgi:hypothetical protein
MKPPIALYDHQQAAQQIDQRHVVPNARIAGLLLAVTLSLPAYAFTPSRVDMGDFSIDTTEVTVGQFARYADSQQLKTAAEKNGYGMEYGAGWVKRTGWSFWFPNGVRGAADEPAVHLS